MEQMILSGSPHIKSKDTTTRIMLDVIIALIPATIAAVYFFGAGVLSTIAASIISAVGCEALIQFVMKREITISDLSAVVTGLLLALNLPAGVPLYVPICGSAFAIIIVKQLFGGIGHNFMNPAVAARCFLLISWPVVMTTFLAPRGGVDAVSTATPLAILEGNPEAAATVSDMFLGSIAGSMGETSALALLIGFVYLLIRKVVTARIPLAYLGTVAVIALIADGPGAVAFHLLAGGLMLAAFFMATDYSSTPMSPKAQLVFGIGCGAVTMVIRLFGGYPEGVSFAILFMNLLVPILDKAFRERVYGGVRSVEK